MNNRKEVIPEYIYLTIPAEYVCVYHRIMAMLADYGEEMLKDCKAACTDRNSGTCETAERNRQLHVNDDGVRKGF